MLKKSVKRGRGHTPGAAWAWPTLAARSSRRPGRETRGVRLARRHEEFAKTRGFGRARQKRLIQFHSAGTTHFVTRLRPQPSSATRLPRCACRKGANAVAQWRAGREGAPRGRPWAGRLSESAPRVTKNRKRFGHKASAICTLASSGGHSHRYSHRRRAWDAPGRLLCSVRLPSLRHLGLAIRVASWICNCAGWV